jgi:hypothetical protein
MNITEYTPSQEIIFEPYSQKYFSFYDDIKVNYYITPEFGKITNLIGKDIILEGFGITDLTYTNDSFSFIVGLGRLIINNTYVEISTSTDITYSKANVFDDAGFFVLSARFLNTNTLMNKELTFHLTYFTSDNISFNDFDTNKNKIILGIFNFEKISNNISNMSLVDTGIIVLDGVTFTIRNTQLAYTQNIIDGGIINFDELTMPVGTNTLNEMVTLLKLNDLISSITIT